MTDSFAGNELVACVCVDLVYGVARLQRFDLFRTSAERELGVINIMYFIYKSTLKLVIAGYIRLLGFGVESK